MEAFGAHKITLLLHKTSFYIKYDTKPGKFPGFSVLYQYVFLL